MLLAAGARFGNYEIVAPLGAGGMGEVYRAKDLRLGREIALKVLPAGVSGDPERLARFEREARAVAGLNHPNIVTLHSVEEAEGARFLTMELVEGQSLDRIITPGGLPVPRVLELGIAIADALAAAHEKGIVHRDLKPANVMLTRDGRVKVLDFGLAKLLTPDSDPEGSQVATLTTPLSSASRVVGTVPYMSPEQVKGGVVDARTDIFSLGVVLYELATGRRPFQGDSAAEITSSILRDTPRPLTEARGDAPRHLSRIIEHCLEKDPESRIQSAKDVRNELRAVGKELDSGRVESSIGANALSGATAPAVAARRPAARLRWWLVGAAVVLVIAAAVVWFGGALRMRAPRPGSETNSLAVLPFVDMSQAKDQEYFSDGLTEELLNVLAKSPALKVTGRTSAFAFKGKNEDLRTIGQKLGVANILEGSVRKSGDRIRITAQLVKAADGFHLWSETYDRKLDDVFAVQDDIASAVAAALEVKLLPRIAGAGHNEPEAEAYDLVLQARYALKSTTPEGIARAGTILDRAEHIAPNYAPVWAERGLQHLLANQYVATSIEAGRRALKAAQEALERAIAIDPQSAIAYSRLVMCQIAALDFSGAERSSKRALELDPTNYIVRANAAALFALLGRAEEAAALFRKELQSDPLNCSNFDNLAKEELILNQLDQAELHARKAIGLAPPASRWGLYTLACVQLARRDLAAARESFARDADLSGQGDYSRLWNFAIVEFSAGNEAASRAAMLKFERSYGADDPMSLAQLHAWRGETDAAFASLDRAWAAHDPAIVNIPSDFFLRSLHSDPRWTALKRKIGLPTD